MRYYNSITVLLLIGIGACATSEEPNSDKAAVASQSQGLKSEPAAAPQPIALTDKAVVVATAPGPAPKQLSAAEAKALNTPVAAIATAAVAARPVFSNSADAAAGSLATLADLVGGDSPAKRGFNSIAEAKSASIGGGVPVKFVRLDQLTAYKAGREKTLLTDTRQVVYPVTVGGDVRTSVTVQQQSDGTWQITKYGSANLAKTLDSAVQRVAVKKAVDAGSVSLVEIPTVGATFMSHTERDALMLTALYDVPGTSLTAGSTLPAGEVFSALSKVAAQVNPDLPN
jgi:hypothetical protein